MPYVEIIAPLSSPEAKQRIVAEVTREVCDKFAVDPAIVTLFFMQVPSESYGHAGRMGYSAPEQRVLAKVHAFPRSVEARQALARPVAEIISTNLGVLKKNVAVYFFDREMNQVAHDGVLFGQ